MSTGWWTRAVYYWVRTWPRGVAVMLVMPTLAGMHFARSGRFDWVGASLFLAIAVVFQIYWAWQADDP